MPEAEGQDIAPSAVAQYLGEKYGDAAAMDFLSLQSLLMIGFGDEEAFALMMPDIDEVFGEDKELSVYTGINRSAFRAGVALTSAAEMEQNAGKGNAYDQIWDNTGIVAIAAYAAAALSIPVMIAGGVMVARGYEYVGYTVAQVADTKELVAYYTSRVAEFEAAGDTAGAAAERATLVGHESRLSMMEANRGVSAMSVAGRWVVGVGGALLIGAAIVKGVQLYKYYQRTMTPIPRMIVDESDIVTYLVDDDGIM